VECWQCICYIVSKRVPKTLAVGHHACSEGGHCDTMLSSLATDCLTFYHPGDCNALKECAHRIKPDYVRCMNVFARLKSANVLPIMEYVQGGGLGRLQQGQPSVPPSGDPPLRCSHPACDPNSSGSLRQHGVVK